MKAVKQTAPPVEPPFEPIVLTITLETAEEARAMYAIFCHTRNIRLLADQGNSITDALGRKFDVNTSSGVISNKVTHGSFFCNL